MNFKKKWIHFRWYSGYHSSRSYIIYFWWIYNRSYHVCQFFRNYLLYVNKIKGISIHEWSHMIFEKEISYRYFFFIDDVYHVSRSVSSVSMMTYRRMSIGTVTDRINGESYDYRKDSDLQNWYGY